MKTKLCIILLSVLASTSLYSQKQIDAPYDFPVKPGMPEWAACESHEEMVSACQIPENILSQMSTSALVETCLNYPLKYDYYAFNDIREGLLVMLENFNGLRELGKRESGSKELIENYKKTPVIEHISYVKKNDYPILKLEYVELLLSNEIFF